MVVDLAPRLLTLSRALVQRPGCPDTIREWDSFDAFGLASDCVDEAHTQHLLGRWVRAFTAMDEAMVHLRRADLSESDIDLVEASALWGALADLAYPEDREAVAHG